MSRDEIQQFLEKKFPGKTVKYVGCGTDSTAFKVGDRICRFPHNSADVYKMEAELCNFIRPNISVDIPNVEIVSDGGAVFAIHKMIQGGKWSWHKFSWHPRRQRNLSRSYARFLAELHGVDAASLQRRIPELRESVPYCDIDEISDFLARFMTPGQLRFFRKNYERITGAPVAPSDMVFIHMGMKGANSVVGDDGAICGVFDFCSGGVYERWRDFVLVYLGRNARMFRQVRREYGKLTGLRPDAGRIADLAVIEFLWRRRLYPNGVFAPRNDHFIKKNIAVALTRFHRLPKKMSWIIYARMSLHDRIVAHRRRGHVS